MDEFLMVKELVPFLEYENYPVVPSANSRPVAIGDQGLVAFRTPDDSIFCGNIEETLAFLKNNQELVTRNPILRVQLNRIESAELQPSYDAWRDAANIVFDDADQKKLWLDSELLIFQKQKQIWSDIDPTEPVSRNLRESSLQGSLADYGFDFLVEWLAKRSNFNVKGWTAVWHHVNEGLPFDERVGQIGVSWMYALGEEDYDFQQSKSILYALLQRRNSCPDINWRELAEFVSDRLHSEPYLLYTFLKPRGYFSTLFVFLILYGHTDDVLKLVDFCVGNVPKDEEVLKTLEIAIACALDRLVGEDKADRPTTDRGQKQLETALNLLETIRELPRGP
jgi:hypothetical protein